MASYETCDFHIAFLPPRHHRHSKVPILLSDPGLEGRTCARLTGCLDFLRELFWRFSSIGLWKIHGKSHQKWLLYNGGSPIAGWFIMEKAMKNNGWCGGFYKWGYPFIAGWFISMGKLGVPPWLRKPPNITNQWIGFVGGFLLTRKPHSSWENRWFPVKIFQINGWGPLLSLFKTNP